MTQLWDTLPDNQKIEQLKKDLDAAHGQLAALEQIRKTVEQVNNTISALADEVAISQFAIQAVARITFERNANLKGNVSTAVAKVVNKGFSPTRVEEFILNAFKEP